VPSGMHTPISISLFSEQILGARLYKDLWLNNQYKVIIFYEVHLWCIRKDICILLAQQDGRKITHSCMIFVFMAQFLPPNPTQFVFSCRLSESLPWLSFYLRKKEKKGESYIDWIIISMIVCLQRPLQFQLKLTSSR